MPELPAYLTKRDVAQRLRVSTRTVERWIADGRLEALRTPGGGRVLVRRASLLELEHRLEETASAGRA